MTDKANNRPAGSILSAADAYSRTTSHGARLLDVRTTAEFAQAHIPGSYNVPLDQIAEHARELSAVGEPVIIVCRSGARATKAQATLAVCGMTDACVLEGGITAWRNAHLPLREGSRRWDIERQVRFVAGLLVAVSTAAGFLVHPALFAIAGAVGTGLVVAALTNSCLMGQILLRLPFNQAAPACTVDDSVQRFLRKQTIPAVDAT